MRSRDCDAKLPAPESSTQRAQPRRSRRRCACSTKALRTACERALLAVEVGAVGRGRRAPARRAARCARPRRRARSSARCAGVSASAMRSVSPVGSRKQDRLDQRAGRRAEQRRASSSIAVAQAVGAEARRVDRRAERVAVLEHEAAGVGPGARCRRCAPTRSAARAQRGSASTPARDAAAAVVAGIAAFDADEDQARGRAALQLVEQHRLLGRRCRGQECRQVGDVVGAPARSTSAAATPSEPERDRDRAARAGRSVAGVTAAPRHGAPRGADRLDRHHRAVAVGEQHLDFAHRRPRGR